MTSSKHDLTTELNASQESDKLVVITINDQPQRVEFNVNLQQIIIQFSLPELGCVFAINNQVVPRSEWSSTDLPS